jgi:translation elongation factor EF-Ts
VIDFIQIIYWQRRASGLHCCHAQFSLTRTIRWTVQGAASHDHGGFLYARRLSGLCNVKTGTAETLVATCEDKIRFVATYSAAVEAYYFSVADLELQMICNSKEIYDEKRRATEKARMMCEIARQKLEHHLSMHGC